MWLLIAFAFLPLTTQAQMSGSGTEEDPYLVKTPDDLFDIRINENAYYKMANDIDLTEWITEENPSNGWEPISWWFGTLDGDGHTISGLYVNRPNEGAGLFNELYGSVKNVIFRNPYIKGKSSGTVSGFGGTISNVKVIGGYIYGSEYSGAISGYGGDTLEQNIIISTHVEGGAYCGGIIGGWRTFSVRLQNNYAIECEVYGKYVGGIAGGLIIEYSYKLGTIEGNYFSGKLTGSSYVGGVVGFAESASGSYTYSVFIYKNRFDGCIIGNGYAAGVYNGYKSGGKATGSISVSQNIVTGTIYGKSYVCGISGSISTNNVCATDSLISNSSMPERIGYNGSDNYAYNGMMLMKNGVMQDVNEGGVNGTNRSLRMLMRENTYTAIDFNFTHYWAIVEGVTLPYNILQSTPATIERCFGGENCEVSGTAIGNGTVYVFVDGKMITDRVIGGEWAVSLGNVSVGKTVNVSVETEGMKPSIITKVVAVDPSENTMEQCATPTISFVSGKLHFDCTTEGVTYHYTVTNGTSAEQTGNDNELSSTYLVKVYASKEGYTNSEVATKEIDIAGLKGDINGDGEVTPQDASLILQYLARKITW